ncbi:hypothetical protein TNCT_672911 [Trichonephila clavata]|uniref:Uncharacterized protein n=1 Tax=Trichonephila clavata TaxID=2740835 RepID=A0A8X6KYD7_TRICU|nr:hypothetical protein TNCT_672911 [Trichonephila clavata]
MSVAINDIIDNQKITYDVFSECTRNGAFHFSKNDTTDAQENAEQVAGRFHGFSKSQRSLSCIATRGFVTVVTSPRSYKDYWRTRLN